MTYRGHVKNGQIMLDEPAPLPEGAEVSIELIASDNGKSQQATRRARTFKPIDMPGGSLAEDLVRDRR